MSDTDTAAPAPVQQDTPREGEQWASARAAEADATYEATTRALAPTAEADYGPDPRPVEPNPPFDVTEKILSDHGKATAKAAKANDGISGDQDAPRYQPQVGIRDPETGEQIDPAAPNASAQGKTGYKPDDGSQANGDQQ